MSLEAMFRSTRVSTLQAYHGAVASPVMHALTARQLLVVARERCRSCARDGKKECCAGGLAGWRVGRETAPMAVSAVESGIDGRTWISSPGIIRPHEAIRRVKAGRSRLAIVMGAVSHPTCPHSCLKNTPLHVFTRRCAAKTRFWHEESSHPRRHRGKTPDDTRPRPGNTAPDLENTSSQAVKTAKTSFCCTRRAEGAERSGPKPISIPAPFMRARPSAWLWHSDFDTNFNPRALHEGATSSFGSAALSQSNFNPRALHEDATYGEVGSRNGLDISIPAPCMGV